jgi:DNA primase
MGRPPSTGAPAFRFLPSEVAEMEARLQQLNNAIPSRAVLQTLADKFSASPERAGRVAIQPKQNRRYSHRAKTTRAAPPPAAKMTPSGADHIQHAANSSAFRAAQPSAAAAHHGSSPSTGKNPVEGVQVEFEAKSARDGAWYADTHISYTSFLLFYGHVLVCV